MGLVLFCFQEKVAVQRPDDKGRTRWSGARIRLRSRDALIGKGDRYRAMIEDRVINHSTILKFANRAAIFSHSSWCLERLAQAFIPESIPVMQMIGSRKVIRIAKQDISV